MVYYRIFTIAIIFSMLISCEKEETDTHAQDFFGVWLLESETVNGSTSKTETCSGQTKLELSWYNAEDTRPRAILTEYSDNESGCQGSLYTGTWFAGRVADFRKGYPELVYMEVNINEEYFLWNLEIKDGKLIGTQIQFQAGDNGNNTNIVRTYVRG